MNYIEIVDVITINLVSCHARFWISISELWFKHILFPISQNKTLYKGLLIKREEEKKIIIKKWYYEDEMIWDLFPNCAACWHLYYRSLYIIEPRPACQAHWPTNTLNNLIKIWSKCLASKKSKSYDSKHYRINESLVLFEEEYCEPTCCTVKAVKGFWSLFALLYR